MIVIDSSAVVETLIHADADPNLIEAMTIHELAAPHILDAEVLNVLRSLARGERITSRAAQRAQEEYWNLRITRYPLAGLAARIWELRHNYTAYDASYIALAEILEAPLATCDKKLAGHHHAQITLYNNGAA